MTIFKRSLLCATLCVSTVAFAQEPAKPVPSNDETAASEHVDTTPPGLPHIKAIEHKEIVYHHGSGVDQVLDVYEQPGGKAAPVIVYWHGGAWWKGQRPQSQGGFRPLINMGFSVVSVDYRLTGVAKAPAAVEDVRCSLAWVAKNAAQYHFDTSRIVAYGTSAGGHLALMAGYLPASKELDPPECGPVPKVAAVLDFYGIPDVYGVVASGIPLSKSTVRWVGGEGAKDPDSLKMAKAMSPNTYLRAGLPPTFIAHGDADPVVPYTQSTTLKADLTKLNVPVEMHTVAGAGHGKWTPPEMAAVWVDVLAFLQAQHIVTSK